MSLGSGIIDDLTQPAPASAIGTAWQLFTDQVMGGVSTATMHREMVHGRNAIHMRGDVSLDNGGGFVQVSLDLAPEVYGFAGWKGLALDVYGNDETYEVRLRTTDLTESWQSYRQAFEAPPKWRTVHLPFADFTPHRTDKPFNLENIRRLGIVAVGRAFAADLAIGGVRLYG